MPDIHTLYFGLVVFISLCISISLSWSMGSSSATACKSGSCSPRWLLYPMSCMFLFFSVLPISIAAMALQVSDPVVLLALLGGYLCCTAGLVQGLRSQEQPQVQQLPHDVAE